MTPQELGYAISHPPCTGVLVSLTLVPDTERSRVIAHMQAEMMETAKIYLAGRISQWWSHVDQPGALFLLNCTTLDEAREVTDRLPLVKEKLAELTFSRVGPLMPMLTMMGS